MIKTPRIEHGCRVGKKLVLAAAVSLGDLSWKERETFRVPCFERATSSLGAMELSSIGEQVFAVESITKKRVRKVSNVAVLPNRNVVYLSLVSYGFNS